jgi:L-iditol 2-dehydrogenase
VKCANLHGINDLRYEEIQKPACGEDEVLVQVVNCGICGSDIPRVYTKGTYSFPLVIGHEFSGKVVMDPANELTGKKVAVFPLLPCFECESCKVGNYATCENYDYYGSRRDGGMSEYLAVKRWNILPVADNVSYREAAMCEPTSVARHAVSKLNIQPGENLLVSGAGPIGILVGQWAKVFGAENVYYFDVDDRKIDFCKSLGFKQYEKDVHIHCVLEGTGFADALSKCLEAIAPGGRMVLMGNPSKEVCLSQNTYWHILRKELTVYGTWNSSYNPKQNDWVESLKAMAEGKIDVKPLITHVFPLAQCNEAFEMMKNRTEFFNKVMLEMGGNADDK